MPSPKDEVPVSSLAEDVGHSNAQQSTATSGLELEWDPRDRPSRSPARPKRVRAIDWQAEREAAGGLRGQRGVWLVAKVVGGLLALRLAMSLWGAGDASAFSRLVFEITH